MLCRFRFGIVPFSWRFTISCPHISSFGGMKYTCPQRKSCFPTVLLMLFGECAAYPCDIVLNYMHSCEKEMVR